MSTRQIHVFISHSWAYSHHYDKLAEWIFEKRWSSGQASLDFRDYSVPKSDPILNASNDAALRKAIFDQIGRSHVVVIPTGIYAHYSKWIGKEIDGANFHEKPILAIDLRGSSRTASVVATAAAKTVAWSSQSIIDGIWELYR